VHKTCNKADLGDDVTPIGSAVCSSKLGALQISQVTAWL